MCGIAGSCHHLPTWTWLRLPIPARFVGSTYHKDFPGFAGIPRSGTVNASKCPRALSRCRELAERWLKEADATRPNWGLGTGLSTLCLVP